IGIVGIHIQYSCSCVWVSRWCQVWTFRFGHSHLGIHVQYSCSGMCVFMYSGSVVRFVYSFVFNNQVQYSYSGMCVFISVVSFVYTRSVFMYGHSCMGIHVWEFRLSIQVFVSILTFTFRYSGSVGLNQ